MVSKSRQQNIVVLRRWGDIAWRFPPKGWSAGGNAWPCHVFAWSVACQQKLQPSSVRVLNRTHPIIQFQLGTDISGLIIFVLLHSTHPITK